MITVAYDLAAHRAAARKRQRRSRERQANGLATLRIDADEETVAQAIRIRDRLIDGAPVSRKRMQRALAEVIVLWSERWIRTGHV
jgi:hypothetical protein